MNISDYLDWRGDLSFEASPFNRIDALILANIIYMNFTGLVSEDLRETMSISELLKKFKESPDYEERINLGIAINAKTNDLFFKLAETNRYKDVKVSGFKNIFDEENIEQFVAMTFLIGNDAVIVYRGTDDSLVGWYEDFKLSYEYPIPSHVDALSYFEQVCKRYKRPTILLGHSKGGNLALYTAVNCDSKKQKLIKKIYNIDGPGFEEFFYNKQEYKNIEPILESLYPQDDYVGMLLNHPKDFIIVKALNKGVWQHDPLNWQVIGCDFVRCKDFTSQSKIFHRANNDWAQSMSNEKKKKLVFELFQIYMASGCKTNYELSNNKLKATQGMLKAFTERDKDMKKEVKNLINILVQNVKTELPIFNIFDKLPLN